MNDREYKEYKKLSTIDRIVYINSGTITENLHKMIEISEYEKQQEQKNEQLRTNKKYDT